MLDVGRVLPEAKDQGPITIELDGQTMAAISRRFLLRTASAESIWFDRADTWSVAPSPAPPSRKGPHRMGPFKEAFRNRFVLVVGTKGTAEENAVMLARARFDAETFWYRGNGSVEIVPDIVFIDPKRADEFRDRNVILYGHADSNAAWAPLLGDSPVQVERGRVRIGKRTVSGDDLACLFLRPRPGSDLATVGVVAGIGRDRPEADHAAPLLHVGSGLPRLPVAGYARSLAEGPCRAHCGRLLRP